MFLPNSARVSYKKVVKPTDKKSEIIQNPVLEDGEDPFIIFHEGLYHHIQNSHQFTDNECITITSATTIAGLKTAPEIPIWQPKNSDHSKELWAPELHRFPEWEGHSDKWYVYYAASDGKNVNHRMYVLESNTSNIRDGFHEMGRIHTADDNSWAIDMTAFKHPNGNHYAIWSGWENPHDEFPQNLYIAKMKNPWTLEGNRVCISKPEFDWEMSEGRVNEGPQVLVRQEKIILIYSADGSWTKSYKLGQIDHFPTLDPMDPKSWIKYHKPVFETGDTKVWGPGHPSFLHTTDGRDIMFYHVKKNDEHNWNREVRAKEFVWHDNGSPNFGIPV